MQFDDLVGRVIVNLEAAVREYKEAHAYAFDRRDRPTDEQDQRVRTSNLSDNTGSVVVEQGHARNSLRRASRKLLHAEKESSAIRSIISDIFTIPEDEYEPLASYRVPDQQESEQLKESRSNRNRQTLLADAAWTRARLNRLMAEIKEVS